MAVLYNYQHFIPFLMTVCVFCLREEKGRPFVIEDFRDGPDHGAHLYFEIGDGFS